MDHVGAERSRQWELMGIVDRWSASRGVTMTTAIYAVEEMICQSRRRQCLEESVRSWV